MLNSKWDPTFNAAQKGANKLPTEHRQFIIIIYSFRLRFNLENIFSQMEPLSLFILHFGGRGNSGGIAGDVEEEQSNYQSQ